jgi:tetratricopeptide (TPR) repeat protein
MRSWLVKTSSAIYFFLLLGICTVYAQNSRPDALAEYNAGNFERAVQICRDEIAENANNLDSHVVICWSLLRLNRNEDALRYARNGRALSRYDHRIIEILGEIYYNLGQNDEALRYFQEYVSLNPEGQRIELVYYYIGEIYIRQGKFRHADIALSTAVHWKPDNAAWWTRLAYAKENAAASPDRPEERFRDFRDAVTAYEKALSLNHQLVDARRGLERVRQAMGGR